MKTTRILIVDDDPAIRKFVRANLEAREYKVFLAIDGDEAIKLLEMEPLDLILLDIMMPKVDGFEVCQRVREWSKVPIIMLSAREAENDKVRCLDCGADDYLTKPFSLKELLSRIKAVLRRSQNDDGILTIPTFRRGDLEVDLAQKSVKLNGQDIILTGIEYKLLSYLITNSGRVLSHDQLLSRIWGEDYIGATHLIQVNVARLRKKLNDRGRTSKYIETREGLGYMMKITA